MVASFDCEAYARLGEGIEFGALGAANLVDCTYFTKTVRNAAGFVGRQTYAMSVCVLGLLELDLAAGLGTGKVMLVVIEQEKREFVEPILRRLIRVGAKVWTDGGLAYN